MSLVFVTAGILLSLHYSSGKLLAMSQLPYATAVIILSLTASYVVNRSVLSRSVHSFAGSFFSQVDAQLFLLLKVLLMASLLAILKRICIIIPSHPINKYSLAALVAYALPIITIYFGIPDLTFLTYRDFYTVTKRWFLLLIITAGVKCLTKLAHYLKYLPKVKNHISPAILVYSFFLFRRPPSMGLYSIFIGPSSPQMRTCDIRVQNSDVYLYFDYLISNLFSAARKNEVYLPKSEVGVTYRLLLHGTHTTRFLCVDPINYSCVPYALLL